MPSGCSVHFVLPSLKVSGGVKETLRLAEELHFPNWQVDVVGMWLSPHAVRNIDLPIKILSSFRTRVWRVPLDMPVIIERFRRLVSAMARGGTQAKSRHVWIFTHYATLPLALLIPRRSRWYFVQDLEWRFSANPMVVAAMRRFILFFYRRGHILSANRYLTSELKRIGLRVDAEAPVWADANFRSEGSPVRDIDVAMVLRKGAHKRLDLYLDLIALFKELHPSRSLAVITPEDDIGQTVRDQVRHCWIRPDLETMRAIYARSRCFVHLSEHEGFGLPPLEAMGSGCVPYCRNSGGIQAYMIGSLADLIAPKNWPIERTLHAVVRLLDDTEALARYARAARVTFEQGLERVSSRGKRLAMMIDAHSAEESE